MKKLICSCIFFVSISAVLLLTMADAASAAASLNEYWDGHADWKYVTRWTESSLGSDTLLDGIHIEVVGNDWYLFTRTEPFFPESKWGTEVRRSTNKGLSWGEPVPILEPEVGKPWEYVASDGQPFFDGNRWHDIFQCTLCHDTQREEIQ